VFKKLEGLLIIFAVFIMLAGCGYKPSSYYTKKILGDKIYTKVYIDINDPENSVLIKDAVNEAIVSKFRSRIVDRIDKANSVFYVKFKGKSFTPIAYDKDGYVIAYKAKVLLGITYIDKVGKKDSFDVSGTHDFTIEANSVISDSKRFEAIKFASYKAISEFISKLSIKGISSDTEVEPITQSYLE